MLQSVSCKCHYKSTNHITEDRLKICKTYWGSGDYARQRDCIARHVKTTNKGRSTTREESRRKKTYQYSLTVNNEVFQVCQTLFLKTLNIKQRTVYYTLNKKIDASISTAATAEEYVSPDHRGKNTPPNKTPDDDRAFVKSHIESFPAVESHYCQKK